MDTEKKIEASKEEAEKEDAEKKVVKVTALSTNEVL